MVALWNEQTAVQILQGMADGRVPPTPQAEDLDLRLSEIEPGTATIAWEPTQAICTIQGHVHGDVAAMYLNERCCTAGASHAIASTR